MNNMQKTYSKLYKDNGYNTGFIIELYQTVGNAFMKTVMRKYPGGIPINDVDCKYIYPQIYLVCNDKIELIEEGNFIYIGISLGNMKLTNDKAPSIYSNGVEFEYLYNNIAYQYTREELFNDKGKCKFIEDIAKDLGLDYNKFGIDWDLFSDNVVPNIQNMKTVQDNIYKISQEFFNSWEVYMELKPKQFPSLRNREFYPMVIIDKNDPNSSFIFRGTQGSYKGGRKYMSLDKLSDTKICLDAIKYSVRTYLYMVDYKGPVYKEN